MNFVILQVKVSPQTKKLIHQVLADGSVKVYLKAPPEKGKANQQLIEYLSKVLEINVKDLEIMSGATSKIKRLKIFNISLEDINKKLGVLGKQSSWS